MARLAEFQLKSKTYSCELNKVDRKKIYGWSKIETFDTDGCPCKLAGISDGSVILPSGSTSVLKITENGELVSSRDLIGFNEAGEKVEKVPSIYDAPVVLKESTLEDYMALAVKSVYQLNISENKDDLLDALKKGKVYYFIFNYRADYEGDDAFLISNGSEVFAVVGVIARFEFIGLEDNEQEIVEDDSSMDDDVELDFSMF